MTFVCLGAAIWLGLRKPLIVTIAAMFVSAWVMRMYIASHMYETQTVQLYTRTNNQLLYCGLILCALVAHLVSLKLAERRTASGAALPPFPRLPPTGRSPRPPRSVPASPAARAP